MRRHCTVGLVVCFFCHRECNALLSQLRNSTTRGRRFLLSSLSLFDRPSFWNSNLIQWHPAVDTFEEKLKAQQLGFEAKNWQCLYYFIKNIKWCNISSPTYTIKSNSFSITQYCLYCLSIVSIYTAISRPTSIYRTKKEHRRIFDLQG